MKRETMSEPDERMLRFLVGQAISQFGVDAVRAMANHLEAERSCGRSWRPGQRSQRIFAPALPDNVIPFPRAR